LYVAVISDLHLGALPATDTFGHTDSDFLRFLRHLESTFDRIVLLGDVWETLTPGRPGRPMDELKAAMAAHPQIAKQLQRPRYSYLHGNHDWVAAGAGVPEDLVLHDGSAKILFTHGHQHDLLLRHARGLSEFGVWCGGWMRRLGCGPLYRLAAKMEDLWTRSACVGVTSPFQRWALSAARLRGADIVVTGHTHVAARTEHDGQLFLNGGRCCDGRFGHLALDTRSGTYEVRQTW
jgi:predicted phosphodiesterase